MTQWYTTVSFGSASGAPRGPWKTIEEADAALERWRARAGQHAGTLEAAHSVRLVGPYRTRGEARDADISTATVVPAEART